MSTTTSIDLARTARWFHALSDETRLRVVEMLTRGEHCVCDLQSATGAAQIEMRHWQARIDVIRRRHAADRWDAIGPVRERVNIFAEADDRDVGTFGAA